MDPYRIPIGDRKVLCLGVHSQTVAFAIPYCDRKHPHYRKADHGWSGNGAEMYRLASLVRILILVRSGVLHALAFQMMKIHTCRMYFLVHILMQEEEGSTGLP